MYVTHTICLLLILKIMSDIIPFTGIDYHIEIDKKDYKLSVLVLDMFCMKC